VLPPALGQRRCGPAALAAGQVRSANGERDKLVQLSRTVRAEGSNAGAAMSVPAGRQLLLIALVATAAVNGLNLCSSSCGSDWAGRCIGLPIKCLHSAGGASSVILNRLIVFSLLALLTSCPNLTNPTKDLHAHQPEELNVTRAQGVERLPSGKLGPAKPTIASSIKPQAPTLSGQVCMHAAVTSCEPYACIGVCYMFGMWPVNNQPCVTHCTSSVFDVCMTFLSARPGIALNSAQH
jgi:hypothetical protein